MHIVATFEFVRVQFSQKVWRKEVKEVSPRNVQIGDMQLYLEYLTNMGKKGFEVAGFSSLGPGVEVIMLQRKLG